MARFFPIVAVGPLLLAGCSVGPQYVRPSAEVPSAYKEQPIQSHDPNADTIAGRWARASPSDGAIRGNWWEAFGDAELNVLEGQVGLANQDLKAAEARFRAARALIGFARADEAPTVGIGAVADSLRDSPNQPYFPSTTSKATGDFALTADLSYEIDFWGRIHRQVTAATENAQASAADLETAKLSLQAELALDYFNLRSADAQQRLLDDTVKSYEDALQLAQSRFDGGAAPASDVAQAKTQLDTARVQDTDIAVERAQYEHAIAVLIGKPPSEFSLAPSPLVGDPPRIPVGLPSELLQRRPDVAAAERRAGAANEQIGIAISAYYPTVSLNGLGGFEGSSTTNWLNWPSIMWAMGASVSQTVFDAGRRHSKTEAARADYDATIADYRETTLNAFRQVEDNLAALRVLDSETLQQDEAVDSAKANLQIFTDRYAGGRDSYLQVTTAQTNFLQNERNQVEIRRRRMAASVLLVKALGGGWNVDTREALVRTGGTKLATVALPGKE